MRPVRRWTASTAQGMIDEGSGVAVVIRPLVVEDTVDADLVAGRPP